MRWLAIHLPDLPLELYERAAAEPAPLAIGVSRNGERILCCNAPAAARGIRPGLSVGAARALCARLAVLPHRPALEQETLERLAAWAIRFTPQVSLAPPRALLLDAGASLRLFGGSAALLALVETGVAGLGYRPRLALAPTPLGALVLAMQGWGERVGSAGAPGAEAQGAARTEGRIVADGTELRAVLSGLPLASLRLGERERDDLTRMGLRLVGDLLRLPRRGLRERLGPKRMDWLARLLGESPDPRPAFVPPLRYAGRLELTAELKLAESLIFPARRLLAELCGLLAGRGAGVTRLDWRLEHPRGPETCFELGAARPLGDPEPWLALLRARLERLTLPGAVRAIALAAARPIPLVPVCPDLFPALAPPAPSPDTALLDRLRARLGRDAVRGIALVADHRPERAWRWAEPGERAPGIPRPDRPLWLLPEPLPLEARDGRPWLGGALDLGEERERIDTGWWDDLEVARDYFVATTGRGERLWIYREIKGRRGWYLHGVFG